MDQEKHRGRSTAGRKLHMECRTACGDYQAVEAVWLCRRMVHKASLYPTPARECPQASCCSVITPHARHIRCMAVEMPRLA